MTTPTYDKSWHGRLRDKLGWAIMTLGIKIATPWYRAMIGGSIAYGLEAAKRDSDAKSE